MINKIYYSKQSNKQKQQNIDNYLDSSTNGAYLNGVILSYLYDFLKIKDKKDYDLISFYIMPNHIHLLFKPLDKLSKVMHSIKGVTAYKINKILGKTGMFWESSYYDKIIRNEKHFFMVYEYIKNNPLKLYDDEMMDNDRFYGVYE